jgi:type II secretory pathway pseudopilin PulG
MPGSRPSLFARGRAFTLVEAIIALVILTIAVPPMLLAVRTYSVRRDDSIFASRARWLAMERLEDIIADRQSTNRGYSYVVNANYPSESAVTGFTNFSRSTSITETASDLTTTQNGSGIKVVTVTIGYNDQSQTARSFVLSTVVTSYTP